MTTRQRLTLLGLPALLVTAIVVPTILAWNELPDSIATHWNVAGTPDGHMPPAALLAIVGGILLAMWVAVWFASSRMPFEARSFITGVVAVGGLLAAVNWFSVEANRGVADWTAAREVTVLHIGIALAVAVVAGAAGWVLAGPPAGSHEEQDAAGPMMRLAPGTTPVWSSRGRGIVIVAIGSALLVAALAMWNVVSIALVVVSLPVLLFSEVRATVGNHGVVVSLGWLGLPSWTVQLETIRSADVEEVNPLAYGGWGYRARPGARAVVVRRGPALRLHRFDRPDLVLTVDDPERGAALVNALVARRTT